MKLFKPTILKIFLTLILFVLFVPFLSYDTGIRCITTPCPSETSGSLVQYLFHKTVPTIYGAHLGIFIYGLILSYILSAVIVIYFRKKTNA